MTKYLTLYVLILFVFSGCKGFGGETATTDTVVVAEAGDASGLPLPEVPDFMVDPEERVAFVVEHFWEAMDFSDSEAAADTVMIEQSFANFIGILPMATTDDARRAVGSLMDKASVNKESLYLVMNLAESYLNDPNSPMRNEDIYILFLENVAEKNYFDDYQKAHAADALETAMLNRPGTMAADFGMQLRDGKSGTLHQLVAGDTTLVVFYDSDCTHCHETMTRLASMQNHYKIMAVDVVGNRAKWESDCVNLPDNWIVGISTDNLQDKNRYSFPALPALYLLSPSSIVISKDIRF